MSGDGGDIFAVSAAARKIRDVLRDIHFYGYSKKSPFSVGAVEKRMKDYANTNGISIASGNLYMSPKSISHSQRATKVRKGLAVSDMDLIQFPKNRAKMDLFYDGAVFVYTDYKAKFIVHPNYEIKTPKGKTNKVNFITATKVTDSNEFRLPKYRRI